MAASEQTVADIIPWQQSSSITIDPEFRDLILPLTPKELELLEESLIADGCLDSLKAWFNGCDLVLLDGHHRYELCKKHNIPFTVDIVDGISCRDEAEIWIIKNQRGRRNISESQDAYLQGKQYLAEKKMHGGQIPGSIGQSDLSLSTAQKIADQTGSSERTVRRNAEYAEAVDEIREIDSTFTEKVLAEEIKLSKKDFVELTKKPDAERKELMAAARALNEEAYGKLVKESPEVRDAIINQVTSKPNGKLITCGEVLRVAKNVKRDIAQKKVVEKVAEFEGSPTDAFQLFVGDISEASKNIESDSVDVIITDPPYGKEYLPVYGKLAEVAARVLKPGGSLVVMVGQSYLPDIFMSLSSRLTYQWTLAYLTTGASAEMWQRKVFTHWKPLLWFVKGEYKGKWVGDLPESGAPDKRFHEWGQSESGMADIVDRFTQPGDTILDPFVGGGATGVAAIKLGRKFIGIDISQNEIDTTKARIMNCLAKEGKKAAADSCIAPGSNFSMSYRHAPHQEGMFAINNQQQQTT